MTMRIGFARAALLSLIIPAVGCAGTFPGRGEVSARALVAAAPPPVDSADALRTARAAQARFELMRFARLPWTGRIPTAPRCDEIVGRFCLWFEDTPEPWVPPPEADEVTRAREGLLVWLAAAEAAHPADGWIVGQRVRYLVEATRHDEAERVADACAAEHWWCLALSGFVRHSRGEFARAESAFNAALGAMPADVRAEWTDLHVLLAPGERKAYTGMAPAERIAFERSFWHLADPLYSRPGNERRSEHLARHVLIRLYEDARAPDRERWGDDSREILLRYGAAAGWERARPASLAIGAAPIVTTHFASGGKHFLPTLEEAANPSSMGGELLARELRAPRTEYALPDARAFDALAHQVAMFRRGDSALVAAVWEVPADTLPDTARVEAALALGAHDGDLLQVRRRTVRGRRGELLATARAGEMLASVELLAPDEGRAARGRTAVRPTWTSDESLSLSDLLLIAPGDEPPASLEEALGMARAGWTVRRGDRAGLYWEVYARDTTARRATMTLSLTHAGRGWPRRLAERLGLRDETGGLRLQWEERTAGRIAPRAIVLDLGRIEPGTYTLEMRLAGQGSASVRKRIVISK